MTDQPKKEDVLRRLRGMCGLHLPETTEAMTEAARLIAPLPTIDGVAVTLGCIVRYRGECFKVTGVREHNVWLGRLVEAAVDGIAHVPVSDLSWPTPATVAVKQPSAIGLIATERQRQRDDERWSEKHDDGHTNGELADAAAGYATTDKTRRLLHEARWPRMKFDPDDGPCGVWPFDDEWWKPCPGDRIRELVKAGALIVAEIERLQRAEHANAEPATVEVPVERLEALRESRKGKAFMGIAEAVRHMRELENTIDALLADAQREGGNK